MDPHAGSVGLNAGGRGFAGAAMGAHTRTVGHHGQPSGVWGPGGRPKGGARELPFPMAAECAVGAQRVKVEHPRAEGPPPVSYLDARSGDGHNRAAGKGNQQPNHPPGAPTNPQALHRDQPSTPAPQHRPTTHIPGLLGSILGCRGVPVFYPSEGRPLKVISDCSGLWDQLIGSPAPQAPVLRR